MDLLSKASPHPSERIVKFYNETSLKSKGMQSCSSRDTVDKTKHTYEGSIDVTENPVSLMAFR